MKYKDKNDFAQKVINGIPFVQNMNINVYVCEHSISYQPIRGKHCLGGMDLTASFMDKLSGIIDGLRYAYDVLKTGGG